MDRNEAHVLGKVTSGEHVIRAKSREGIIFAVVGELSRIAEQKRVLFTNGANLKSPEGIQAAIEEQGKINGIEFCIDFMINLGEDRDATEATVQSA